MAEQQEKKFLKSFKIFRANKSREGAASQWSLSDKEGKVSLFVDAAKQKPTDDAEGNATFDWDSKLTMKLGEPDVGEILCVLKNIKREVGTGKGLFHANDKGNSVLNFSLYEKDNNPVCYSLRVSTQRDGVNSMVQHLVSFADGEILRVLLERFIARKYDW